MEVTEPESSSSNDMNPDHNKPEQKEEEGLSFSDWKKQKEALCKEKPTNSLPSPVKQPKTKFVRPNNSHQWQQQQTPPNFRNTYPHNNNDCNVNWMQGPNNNFGGYGYFNNNNWPMPLPAPPPPRPAILFGGPNNRIWPPQQFVMGNLSNEFNHHLANYSMRSRNCNQNMLPYHDMPRGARAKSVPTVREGQTKKSNKKPVQSTKNPSAIQKPNNANIAKKSKSKINAGAQQQASNPAPSGSVPKGIKKDGVWVPKPLWPPLNTEVPETKEEKKRIWKEYRQAMKPFKNRDFANAKRTIQRLSKKPVEERDEKEVVRMQQAEEIVTKYKAVLTEKHTQSWLLQLTGHKNVSNVTNGQSAGEVKKVFTKINVHKAQSPAQWHQDDAGARSHAAGNWGSASTRNGRAMRPLLHNSFVSGGYLQPGSQLSH